MTTIPQRILDYQAQLSQMQKDKTVTQEEIRKFQENFMEQEVKFAQHAIQLKKNEQEKRKQEYWTRIRELEVEERIEQKKQKELIKEKQIAQINALRLKLKEIKQRPDQNEVLQGIEELIAEVKKMM